MDFLAKFRKRYEKLGISEQNCTGGSLLTLFFETLEKQPCKQKTV